MAPAGLLFALLLAPGGLARARLVSQRAVATSDLAFGHQVDAAHHHRRHHQPEYEHQENAPVYEHVRPHPDLPGTAETPEQGYVGKDVIHTNFETATSDFTYEYGPPKKPKYVAAPYIPPPP